jgi:phage terminase large subunit
MRYFDQGGKRAVWVVHRRGGKDLTALHQTAKMAMKRVGAYWHVFPTYEQGRKAIWEGFTADGKRILTSVFPDAMVRRKNEQQMMVELKNGSIWRLIGSDKIEVVGAGPVGVVFSEFALAKPNAWNLIRPMLRENGGWASFVTTPRGRNHAWQMYQVAKSEAGWFHDLQTLYDTRAYDPDKTMQEERAEGMPEALIRQEYLCDWTAALVGSVWGDQIELLERAGGMTEFEHPTDGVYTAWDLGISDATAIWFWRLNSGGGLDFIDHYEANGQQLKHFYDVLDSKPYQYVMHWLPHDGAAERLGMLTTIEQQVQAQYPGKVRIGPRHSVMDGIQAGRWLLNRPCRFHPRTSHGIEAMRHYHYEWDEDTKAFAKKPEHDWSSHTADAFRYTAVVAKVTQLAARREAEPVKRPYGAEEIIVKDGKTTLGRPLEELFEEHHASRQKGRRI